MIRRFSRAVTSRWRGEAIVPAFCTLLGSNPHRAVDGVFDVAVVGDMPTMSLASLLRSLAANSKPVVLVVDSNAALATIKQSCRERWCCTEPKAGVTRW